MSDHAPSNPHTHDPAHGLHARVTIAADRYRSPISIRSHRLLADEPQTEGGTDAGPTPIELMLAALGSCKTITARMYADRKGWPLESVEIDLDHAGAGANQTATVRVRFLGPLTDEQRERLKDITDRCPVHRALSGGLAITSELRP
jgi:putative redox protein